MRKVNYAMIAMMAMGLAACSQDDDLTGLAGSTTLSGSVMTEISSSSSNAASTRFDGSTGCWEESDAIGVYLTDSDNSNILNSASNVEFTLSEGSGETTGKFTNETGITYPNDDTSINFHCYYPYNDNMAQSYTLDISDQSENGYKYYELMYGCDGTDGNTVTSSGVTVSFEHLVAKAKIYVTPPSSEVTVSTVTISGLTATATFAPIGGDLTLSDTAGEITPQCTTDDESTADYETYEAIILPDTDISDLCLKFTTSAGYTYVWEISDDSEVTKIDAGYEYIFNIGLGTAPSSSAGSGNDSGNDDDGDEETGTLTKITGEAPGAYTASYYMTDEENGDEVEIYSQAYTYDANAKAVDVDASATDLGTVLSEYVASLSTSDASSSGLKTRSDDEEDGYAVALRFTAGTEYNDFDAFSVPDDITTLMLICDNVEGQASINLTGITSPVLTNLYFYNLDITGDTSTNFVNGGDISGTILAESCNFTEMYKVLNLSNNTATEMSGIYLTDCFVLECYSFFEDTGSTTDITNGINFEDCTFGRKTENSNANICYIGNVGPIDINAENCTFYFYGSRAFNCAGNGYSSANFTNCLIANYSTFFYWVTTEDTDSSGNYYLALGDSAEDFETKGYTGVTTLSDAEWDDVFSSEEYSGEFYLAEGFISSYGKIGDPRWYDEDESSDDTTTEE